ncbi:hypothetical protein [Methylocystis parvus]|uniref:Uncharacterized protein n=1 Tax=Methylocystis parvus TaxID=134 RepID=A0A6B8M661_9HYPH|nr:hypothetical protein [Methylocystis parvus]QGM98381.1 hypothetical protein F7D14_13435 [Methylocystis parvus]WBK01288.1 hypothetical protein MMG94_06130 [Methylocystis parvus OBBP]
MRRVAAVTTRQNAAAAAQSVAWNVTWNPYGPLASMRFGYGGSAIFTTDADYRMRDLTTAYRNAYGVG